MENFTAERGLTGGNRPTGETFVQQSNTLWRPWAAAKEDRERRVTAKLPYSRPVGGLPDAKHSKSLQITHPVKLYWPKSKCFDYLYQDAEMLLRNYPVQASICLYEDSSDDEDSEDEEDEENEKVLN